MGEAAKALPTTSAANCFGMVTIRKQTRAWLKAHKKTLRKNVRALEERGGYCNGEALLTISVSRWSAQEASQPLAA